MIQIYTGDGKGKTTASLGVAIRAAGHGMKVVILQFFKKGKTGEVKFLKRAKNIKVLQFGTGEFVRGGKVPKKLKEKTQEGWRIAQEFIQDDKTDFIILDEFTHAINLGIIEKDEVLKFLKIHKNSKKEIIITGRNADTSLSELADLVTEMRKLKHPYDIGIKARKGTEY